MDTCFIYVSSLNFKEGQDNNKKESNKFIVMWRILKVLILKSCAPNSKAPTNPKCEEY